jgi:ABC-type transporter Mla maintaining outer membrane lipid asymmetry ATPase subunit MlaF
LSNLDVDENITLAQRHAARRPAAAILEEARGWADLAGLPEGLPAARPAHLPQETLGRCAWVRACLGAPWLVVLEHPGRGLADGWLEPLVAMMAALRARGTAVIWIGGEEEAEQCAALKPSLILRAEGNTLREEN